MALLRIPAVVTAVTMVVLVVGSAASLCAATYKGKPVDRRWYSGKAVSTTYGGYDNVQVKFEGERVYIKVGGTQIVAFLDEETITDPHEIGCNDPKRGVNWVLSVYDLGH